MGSGVPPFLILCVVSGYKSLTTKSTDSYLSHLQLHTGMSQLFPSIIPSGDDFRDDEYRKAELADMEYQELSSIAAEHPSDKVHGRMSQDELIAGLTGLKRQ